MKTKTKRKYLEGVLKKYKGCSVSSSFIAGKIMEQHKSIFIDGRAVGKMMQKYNFEKIGAETAPKLYIINEV